MFYFSRILIGFFFAFVAFNNACAKTPAAIGEIPLNKENLLRLQRGNILVSVKKVIDPAHGKSAQIAAVILINANAEQIWPVLTECDQAPKFIPGLIKCEKLETSHDGLWDVRRHTSSVGFGLPKIISEFRAEFNPAHSLKFSRTGGNLKSLEGTWNLEQQTGSGKVLLSYQARLSSNSIFPDSLLRRALKSRIPKVLKALRREILTQSTTATLP